MSGYTAAQLADLKAAYASGVLKIRYSDGREVTYASMSDLALAISRIEADLSAATSPAVTHYNPIFSRGL